ncbi:hypothetical protein HY345_04570 [Candidatus Microgenomates bacterium]|nr:hypothetical protein [Candidatus Microgenomates bacterium]
MKKNKKGHLTIFAGPMFSGKTTKLIKLVEILQQNGKKVLTVKPSIDTRYTKQPKLASHDLKTAQAVLVDLNRPDDILELVSKNKINHVILDELNFFHKTKTIKTVRDLLKNGVDVTGSGLAYDYRRKTFGPTLALSKIANQTIWLYAICQKCGRPAEHTERTGGGTGQVVVGAADVYIASCKKCHKIYR